MNKRKWQKTRLKKMKAEIAARVAEFFRKYTGLAHCMTKDSSILKFKCWKAVSTELLDEEIRAVYALVTWLKNKLGLTYRVVEQTSKYLEVYLVLPESSPTH